MTPRLSIFGQESQFAPGQPRVSLILQVFPILLGLLITLPPLSSSRILTWPWAPAAALFWIIPLVTALVRLALRLPFSRFGGSLDAAFGLLAIAGLAATACSPLRATIAPQLIPFLGALSLPYALLPLLRSAQADRLVSVFVYPLLFTSLFLWLPAASARNAQPFGHANTTGAVCALAACLLAGLAARAVTRPAFLSHAAGAVLAVALTISSASRGAALALAAVAIVVAGLHFLRRGRVILFSALALLALAVAAFTNHRLRELVLHGSWSAVSNESNAQRIAMLKGGFALAGERPLLGWGPGAVPHAFPSVRASLPGAPDNYLQLHNTPAQAAATLGYTGLFAIAFLGFCLARRVRPLISRSEHIPVLVPIICGLLLTLFDHSFATPAFALLAAWSLAALPSKTEAETQAPSRHRRWLFPVLAAVLALLAVPFFRDLAARAAWDSALDAAVENQPGDYATRLRRALELAPADPFYADQLAAHLTTGHPFTGLTATDPGEAISVLRATVARNPAHESARYNLGWLLLPSAPAAAEAADHLAAAAHLAPARAEVYLGLAIARIQSGNTASAVAPLAAEVLLDPAFAWSPRWRDPILAALRSAVLARAADFLAAREMAPAFVGALRSAGPPVDAASAYRRVRTGHGVLYGHPDGPAPVDISVLINPALPPELTSILPPKGFVSPTLLLICAELTP